MNIEIRSTTPEDWPAICQFAANIAILNPLQTRINKAPILKARHFFPEALCASMLAVSGQQIVGHYGCYIHNQFLAGNSQKVAYFGDVCIAPAWQQQGLAKILQEKVIQAARMYDVKTGYGYINFNNAASLKMAANFKGWLSQAQGTFCVNSILLLAKGFASKRFTFQPFSIEDWRLLNKQNGARDYFLSLQNENTLNEFPFTEFVSMRLADTGDFLCALWNQNHLRYATLGKTTKGLTFLTQLNKYTAPLLGTNPLPLLGEPIRALQVFFFNRQPNLLKQLGHTFWFGLANYAIQQGCHILTYTETPADKALLPSCWLLPKTSLKSILMTVAWDDQQLPVIKKDFYADYTLT